MDERADTGYGGMLVAPCQTDVRVFDESCSYGFGYNLIFSGLLFQETMRGR